jgi:hypothetical protein
VIRTLPVNGWIVALEGIAPRAVTHWRGASAASLAPPRRKARGEWVEWRPSELTVGTSRRVHGLQADRLEPVSPAAAVEGEQGAEGPSRFEPAAGDRTRPAGACRRTSCDATTR